MLRTKRRLTYQDYLQIPDESRYELLEGVLFVVPSPDFRHQAVSRNLEFLLWAFVREHGLGVVLDAPFDVVLTQHDVVQPDLLFLSEARRGQLTETHLQGAPDLVVEILSPSTRERDLLVKKALYARHGVREYWIVDPREKTAEVWILSKAGFTLHGLFLEDDILDSLLLPGFRPPLKEIFTL